MFTVKPGFLLPLVALSLVLPASSAANPVRVEGLVGDPREGMTHMFLEDSTNIFLNPALATHPDYLNRIDISLGVGAGHGLTLEPFGGTVLGNSSFSFGLYLNREADRYSDQGAMAAALAPLYGGGVSSTPRYLPIDVLLAFDLGGVSLGIGAYAAFGRTRSYSEAFVIDDRVESTVTEETTGSHYISASIGVAATTRKLSPQGWFRFTSVSDWQDSLSYLYSTGPDGEPDFADVTSGLKGAVSISGGFRMPVKLRKEITMVPAISVAFGRSSVFFDNRLANLASEDDQLVSNALALTVGTAVNYRPTDSLLAVFSISADILSTSIAWDNMEDDEALSMMNSSSTRVRLPVITIGAEADLMSHLRLRGCIRAGMALGLNVGGDENRDDDGLLALSNSNDTAADPLLSAAFGLSFPFEALDIDVTIGGDLVSAEEGSFFSQAGVAIYLP